MNLGEEIYRFGRWTYGSTRRFIDASPVATLFVIAVAAVSPVLELVAFLLPLKILMLAATEGVPGAFFFIHPDHKSLWILGLAGASVAAYGLSQFLTTLSSRWSIVVARKAFRRANALRLRPNDEQHLEQAFRDFTHVLGSGAFVLLSLFALFWIYRPLVWLVLALLVFLLVVSAVVLRRPQHPPQGLQRWIITQTGQYLNTWQTLLFFGSFGIILSRLLGGQVENLALAIVGFIIIRRTTGSLSGVLNRSIGLARRREQLYPLLYSSQRLQSAGPSSGQLALNQILPEERHKALIAEALGIAPGLHLSWQDCPRPQIQAFRVRWCTPTAEEPQTALAVLYPPSCRLQVENEVFLFSHLERRKLAAPTVLGSWQYEGYVGQILECFEGKLPQPKEWAVLRRQLVSDLLAVEPPAALVREYQRSHPLLSDLLTEDFCQALSVAVDTSEEGFQLDRFIASLPSLRQHIAAQPIAFFNPELVPGNICPGPSGWQVTAWGKWMIAPVGAVLHLYGLQAHGESLLASAQEGRPSLAEWEWTTHLALAAHAQALVRQIQSESFRAGLETIDTLLAFETVESAAHDSLSTTRTGVAHSRPASVSKR